MKKLVVVLAVSLMATAAFAKRVGPGGCGLGSMLFEGKDGLLMNVLASTTNGSSGNQTFGMTSGTSNCDVSQKVADSRVNFIEANKVALSNDIARGEGETLASLGALYGCKNVDRLGSVLQKNYRSIFTNGDAAAVENRISGVIVTEQACI